METYAGLSLRINAPEFFADQEFVTWLNDRTRTKFTWHEGGEPGDWSDVIVLVEPSLTGEGSDSDMPAHVWEQILQACRVHVGTGKSVSEMITVRLTNLSV